MVPLIFELVIVQSFNCQCNSAKITEALYGVDSNSASFTVTRCISMLVRLQLPYTNLPMYHFHLLSVKGYSIPEGVS